MIKDYNKSDLTKLCVELLSKTYLDLGQHNVDGKTKVLMAQSLAFDLKQSFGSLLWIDVEQSFWNGVRNTDEFSVCAKTWYKWLKLWRAIIWNNEGKSNQALDKRLKYRSNKNTGLKSINNSIKKITNKLN
tara:strand:+ start:3162 stop:3554 length:393 start_codon:yes stop_codon:yes gene_type:complete